MREVDGMMAAGTAGLAAQRYVVNAPPIWSVKPKERNLLTYILWANSADTVTAIMAATETDFADAIVP